MANLHVGIVAPEFPPDSGGIQTYAWEVAKGLAQRDLQVSVCTTLHEEGEVEDSDLRVLPVLSRNWRHDSPAIGKALARCDILHVMNAGYAWVSRLDFKTVVSVHGNDFIDPNPICSLDVKARLGLPKGDWVDFQIAKHLTPTILRWSLPKTDAVVANSKFTRNQFLQQFSVAEDKVSVGYVGVSDFYFAGSLEKDEPGSRTGLLSVARLADKRKNIDRVIKALSELHRDFPFRYTIVGDGPQRERLELLARDEGIADQVRFLGHVDKFQLRREYERADLFILVPSQSSKSYEGFGIVYLEANACGTPALGARTGGAEEAIKEGESGFYVDEPSVGAVAESLRDFLSGRKSFESSTCRQHADGFRWSQVVDHIRSRYEEILE